MFACNVVYISSQSNETSFETLNEKSLNTDVVGRLKERSNGDEALPLALALVL